MPKAYQLAQELQISLRMSGCSHISCPRCHRWKDSTMMLIHAKGCRIRLSVEGGKPFRARRAMLLAIAAELRPKLSRVGSSWISHSHSNPGAKIREWQRGISLHQASRMESREERLGLFIRLKRHDLGLTQQELADRCQISRAHLSQIETGRYRIQRGTLMRLAECLAFDPSAIE